MPEALGLILNYDGDKGNTTTILDHTLYTLLIANTTVRHVTHMQLESIVLGARYLHQHVVISIFSLDF